MTKLERKRPVVLGLGNPLFQDEGLGIHVIHQLMQGSLAEKADLVDGGTDGLMLLGTVEAAQHLLVIDAIDGGFPPGTIKQWEAEQIPLFTYGKISPHQLGFQEVLALARMRSKFPEQMILLGVHHRS
jgi:hydrogenase maturation protease